MNTLQNQPEPVPDRARKPYSKPQLQVYGDLREITQNVGGAGVPDPPPSAGGMNKTH
jgi:hypothetical protein